MDVNARTVTTRETISGTTVPLVEGCALVAVATSIAPPDTASVAQLDLASRHEPHVRS